MASPRARALTAAEVELLAAVARRKIPGPVARSPERDRLRRSGLLEARAEDFRQGQDTLWVVTDAGRAYLEARG